MHKTPHLAQLSTPRRAQARPGAHSGRIVALGPAVSWPGQAVSQAPGCRVAAPARAPCAVPSAYALPCLRLPRAPSRAPRLSYRGPSGRVMGAGCAPAWLYRRPSALHTQPNQPPQSRYKFCIVTLPSQSTACNTIFVLQHTSNNPCNTIPIAIHFTFQQCIAIHLANLLPIAIH